MNKKEYNITDGMEKLNCWINLNPDTYIKNNKLPRYVSHYTSPEGFFNIIRKKTLRFTDSLYLNDKDEQKNIYKLLSDLIDDKNSQHYNKEVIEVAKKCIESSCLCENLKQERFFIFSSSSEKDELSLWNYYTKNAVQIGYSICLDTQNFEEVLDNKFNEVYSPIEYFGAFKVIYEDANKKNILLDLLKDSTKALATRQFKHQKETILKGIEDFIKYFSIIFKNEKFKNENEIRFILKKKTPFIYNDQNENYHHRIQNGMFIPYLELPILEGHTDIISEIHIGPGLEQDFAKQCTCDFLKNNNIKIDVDDIIKSKIPLRY